MLSSAQVLEQALELSAEEREVIAVHLLGSLKPAEAEQKEIDEAWADEIEKRAAAVDCGETQLLDASEVFERAYRSLKRGNPR